jgi:hypothetical protein
VPDRRDLILQAVAGKGVERGLVPEVQEDGTLLLRFPESQDERQDNLHKQSIRSLVGRIAPDWKIHIDGQGLDTGFVVEVRPKPGKKPVEYIAPVPPGPVMEEQEIDLTNEEKVKELAKQLGNIASELAKLTNVFVAMLV